MKKLLTLITLGLTLGLGTAHAADEKAPANKTTKLGQCSAEAKGLKGAEYKKKRDECMKSADAPAASPTCEKSATDMKLHGAAKTAHLKKCMADAK